MKKKRMQQCKNYTVKYRLYNDQENKENGRLIMYLEQTGQSANSYIKMLIKNDLDNKGFHINDGK